MQDANDTAMKKSSCHTWDSLPPNTEKKLRTWKCCHYCDFLYLCPAAVNLRFPERTCCHEGVKSGSLWSSKIAAVPFIIPLVMINSEYS